MNHSPRLLRGNLLQARMADLAATGMRLEVACPRCRDRRELAAAAVVAERSCGALRVDEFIRRLRCSVPGCGERPSRVEAVDRCGGRRVVLAGTGSE
jgi:hypothetical protein